MHTFYLVYIQGTNSAKIFSDLKDFPESQRSAVIFMVRDIDENRGLAVITSIQDLYNIWIIGPAAEYDSQFRCASSGNFIRPHLNWRSDLQDILIEGQDGSSLPENNANQFYIYAYASPINYKEWLTNRDPLSLGHHTPTSTQVKPFYIGRGIGGRWLEHIKEAMQHVSIQNVPPGAHFEYGKILKIYEYLIKASEHFCQELIRKIAIFSGQYAKEKSVAAELFLINMYGVYQLKNLTRGEMRCENTEFIARPRHSLGNKWQEIVGEFSESGINAFTQSRKNHLIAFELNQEFPLLLSSYEAISPSLKTYGNANLGKFATDGTDIFYRMQIVGANNAPLALLDLKISDVSSSCAINIRPILGNEFLFPRLIADSFFGGDLELALARIRSIPSHPYFKPFASNSNGREDVWFDFTEINNPVYQINDCPWLGRGMSWSNVTLSEALITIVGKFHS